MPGEIVVKIEGEETPSPETPPIIVVPESPAGSSDVVVVFTLEMLATQIAELKAESEAHRGALEGINGRLDNHSERLVAVEYVESEPEPEEESEIVAEVIPPQVETSVDEVKPEPRKRRFV